MNLGTSILLYQIIWLVLFFLVLPWGSSKDSIKSKLLFKLGLTTVFACIGWIIAYTIIVFSPFSFREEKAPWMLLEKKSFSPSPNMVKKAV